MRLILIMMLETLKFQLTLLLIFLTTKKVQLTKLRLVFRFRPIAEGEGQEGVGGGGGV